jgi:hypothetical protein
VKDNRFFFKSDLVLSYPFFVLMTAVGKMNPFLQNELINFIQFFFKNETQLAIFGK